MAAEVGRLLGRGPLLQRPLPHGPGVVKEKGTQLFFGLEKSCVPFLKT